MNKLNVLNVSDANKFAFIKGNRPTDEKAIKVKKDSISEHGILCPITAVNGEEVIKSNGHLTDLDGNDRMREEIQANYDRIRQEVRQIVEDEITRIKNDPELCHLIKEEE